MEKSSSIFLGALAAMLLSAPMGAQTFVRSDAGLPTKAFTQHQVKRQKPAVSTTTVTTHQQQANDANGTFRLLRQHQGQPTTFVMSTLFAQDVPARTGSQRKAQANAAETRDEHGIITAPAAGERKLFTRSGTAYYPQSSSVYYEAQEGKAVIVECEDGTVYVKDFLSEYANETWVKGTRQGNTITIPVGQPIGYNANYDVTLSLYWCSYTPGVGFAKETDAAFVFTDNDGVLTLQGSNGYKFAGLFYDTYDAFTGYGDYETVWTQDKSYKPASTELIQVPANLQTEEWFAVGTDDDDNQFSRKVTIGFDGSDIYLKGISENLPESWMKGRIANDTIVFSAMQYQGTVFDLYDIWAVGTDSEDEMSNFVMTINAEQDVISAVNELYYTAHDYEIYYVEGISSITLMKSDPATPITTLPYTNGFDTPVETAAFTIINSNDDNRTWTFSNGVAGYIYSPINNADDWLISPAIQLEAGKAYHFSVDVAAAGKSYPEAIEVKLGKAATAEAMTQEVVPATTVDWTQFQSLESGNIVVDESGLYHFGLHAISEADMYQLIIDNLLVETAVKPTSSRAPRLIVEADPYGAAKTVVTIGTSELMMNGQPLSVISTLKLLRDGSVVNTWNNVPAGEVKVLVDKVEEGLHTYQAIPYDEENEVGQKSERQTVYVGFDTPSTPTIKSVTTQPGKVLVEWLPVTEGKSGGLINTSEVVYAVCTTKTEIEYLFGIFPIEITVPDEVLLTTKNTSAIIEMETEEGEQNFDTSLAVVAMNTSGESDCAEFSICRGQAYQMPIEEHFENGLNYSWYNAVNGSIDFYFDNPDSENSLPGTLLIESESDGNHGQLAIGKLAVSGSNPTLFFDIVSEGNKGNVVKVQAITPDGKCTTLASTTPSQLPRTVQVPLVDYVDEPYIKLVFDFQFNKADIIHFGNVMAFDLLENNMRVVLEAPQTMKAGETTAVAMLVQNMGRETAKKYTLKLYAGEEELVNKDVEASPLPTMGQYFVGQTYTPSVMEQADQIEFTAVVEYEGDEYEADNKVSVVTTLVKSNAPQPQNVKAERQADGVKLTWEAPASGSQQLTEDFEDTTVFPAWSLGGITATEPNGAFGNWTLYDGDGNRVYGWSGIQQNANAQQAWQVCVAQEGLPAASGQQMLISICPGTGAANDWLISPMLSGEAQTLKFKACQLSTINTSSDNFYGFETFEILVSTTDNAPGSFTKIADGQISSEDWAEFSYQLAEGVKYFAIRHTSNDVFGLLLDDITYSAGAANVTAYNIYVDGIDDVYDTVTETQAEVKNQPNAKWVAVSAVYATGEESQPVVVSLDGANQAATAIEHISSIRQHANVYTVDGRLVRQQATDLNGLKGTFIIDGRKVMVK